MGTYMLLSGECSAVWIPLCRDNIVFLADGNYCDSHRYRCVYFLVDSLLIFGFVLKLGNYASKSSLFLELAPCYATRLFRFFFADDWNHYSKISGGTLGRFFLILGLFFMNLSPVVRMVSVYCYSMYDESWLVCVTFGGY